MDAEVVYKVVVPVLAVARTVMWGLSTQGEDENMFNKMLPMKFADGRPIFTVYRVDLVCARCKRRGKDMDACMHNRYQLPHWQSQTQRTAAEEVLRQAGQMDVIMKELRNICTNDAIHRCFNEDVIRMAQYAFAVQNGLGNVLSAEQRATGRSYLREMDNPDKPFEYTPYFITAVDPAGNGQHSQYTAVSCVFQNGKIWVRARSAYSSCIASQCVQSSRAG